MKTFFHCPTLMHILTTFLAHLPSRLKPPTTRYIFSVPFAPITLPLPIRWGCLWCRRHRPQWSIRCKLSSYNESDPGGGRDVREWLRIFTVVRLERNGTHGLSEGEESTVLAAKDRN